MDQLSRHDHDHASHAAALHPSLLRLSVPARLLIAFGLALMLGLALIWAAT